MFSLRQTFSVIAAIVLFAEPCAAAQIALPKPVLKGTVSVEEALAQRRSIRSYKSTPLTMKQVSMILWSAQGITAPGGKRTSPSAGARYPLTLYLAAGAVDGLAAGIYRFAPESHSLELIAQGDQRSRLANDAGMQAFIANAPVMVIVCADYEAMGRYGERGRSFADFEIGHASQNLLLEAVALGLASVPVGAFNVAALSRALGLPSGLLAVYLFPVGYQK